ncbi:hypothetical protein BO99DRAFT_107823 [Aspergillus violaceofuscus CBS 115571]|uniref:Uncharacterized protein n=1 Tax=Aspergillus violaceofuscus (strain CBS 115571) TaxID=1450538 RepID=A0A2V5HAC4_ASPV1|nr:hypothetical protein BO99DRAFT_107823 [Aspergillus violaceofuscus CBS 115571]
MEEWAKRVRLMCEIKIPIMSAQLVHQRGQFNNDVEGMDFKQVSEWQMTMCSGRANRRCDERGPGKGGKRRSESQVTCQSRPSIIITLGGELVPRSVSTSTDHRITDRTDRTDRTQATSASTRQPATHANLFAYFPIQAQDFFMRIRRVAISAKQLRQTTVCLTSSPGQCFVKQADRYVNWRHRYLLLRDCLTQYHDSLTAKVPLRLSFKVGSDTCSRLAWALTLSAIDQEPSTSGVANFRCRSAIEFTGMPYPVLVHRN